MTISLYSPHERITSLQSFQPINTWKNLSDIGNEELKKLRWAGDFIVDISTGQLYWKESPSLIRAKCLLLTLGTPFIQTAKAIYQLFLSLICLTRPLLLSHATIREFTRDALRLLWIPTALVGMQLSAIYGLINPLDGRKLYATFERSVFKDNLLAPCFQPSPTGHFFSSKQGPGAL